MIRQAIYYHNDVDGVMSAAAYLLGTKHKERTVILKPARSKYRSSFLTFRPDYDEIVVLDYAYNQFADVWIDHHKVSDLTIGDRCEVHYNPHAKSAFEIVSDIFGVGLKWVPQVNKHDSADYSDFAEVFESLEPANVLRSYLEQPHGDMIYNHVVMTLVQNNLDIERALIALEINGIEVLERDNKKISETLGNLVISENIGIVVAEEHCMPPRYSEFYEYPHLNFCIRFTCAKGGKYSVRISANPINYTGVSIIDIVRELELKSFGGHDGIVGGIIKESEEPEFTRKICEALNGKVRSGSIGSDRTDGDGEDSRLSLGGDE